MSADTMTDMSSQTTVNGHVPDLAATTTALPTQVVAASQPGGGGTPVPAAGRPTVRPRKVKTGSWVQNLLTAFAAGIAMAASSTGMWKLFGDVLHIDNLWVRAGLFAVFEVALLAEAFRARSYRIEYGTSSIDDKAVWAIAATTGVLASLDEVTWAGRGVRIALPLVAAFLFERLITTERRKKEQLEGGPAKQKINWRVSPHRLMVALGLADSSDRTIADVDLTRRMARLATLAYRAHNSAGWRRSGAVSKFQRSLAAANERLGMATNAKAMEQFRASLALLNGSLAATTAAAVETASPWLRATTREMRELGLPARRPAAAPPAGVPPTPVPAGPDVEATPRKAAARAAAKANRRSAAEWQAEYEDLLAAEPEMSEKKAASLLGISEGHLRSVHRAARRQAPTS